jgi:hypothetical protein
MFPTIGMSTSSAPPSRFRGSRDLLYSDNFAVQQMQAGGLIQADVIVMSALFSLIIMSV